MNDTAFTLYFISKFYAAPLLLSTIAVAILCSVFIRSFRVILWSTVALSVAVNVWVAVFVVFRF